MKYLLTHYEHEASFFGGSDVKSNALVNMWVDFCTYNVWPLYSHTVGQVLGN